MFNKIVELPFIKYYKGEEYDANKKFSFSLFNTYENKILTIDEIKGVLNKLSKPHSNNKNKNIEVRSVQQIDTQDEEIENNDSQVLKNNKTDEGKDIE